LDAKQANIQHFNLPKSMAFWAGLLFFVVVMVSIAVGVYKVLNNIHQQKVRPVASVVIRGELPFTSRAEIKASLLTLDLQNFFKLDVDQVQKNIEALPWVYSASVRKQWPDTLQLYVVDQRPVALWNDDFLLNERGQAFQADKARITGDLPSFFGPEGSELVAMDNYRNLSELLAYRELAIKELILSERFAWQLTLNDGVKLQLGREERVKRIQRFIDVYQQIYAHQSDDKVIDYIDLRYDTGLAVGWKQVNGEIRV
jgi:cell division protein FtsQ